MAADEHVPGGAVGGARNLPATVELVAQALRLARDAGGGCLLLGAGASVSAGIPTAAGLVELARERFPESYRLAQAAAGTDATPPYHVLMDRLSLGERQRLVGDVLANASLNWEHLVVAELMAQGFIGPVLTSNFDSLLLSACALANVAPTVYDVAGAADVSATAVAGGPAVIYLRGQREHELLLAGEEERERFRRRVEPVVRHVLYRGAPIIAIGYSGADGVVVDILAGHGRFTNRLFWVSHLDHAPADAARRLLGTPDNDALVVPGYDAEGFLIALGRRLDAFPPRFIADPYGETLRAWKTIRAPSDADAAAPFEAAMARLLREAETAEDEPPLAADPVPASQPPTTEPVRPESDTQSSKAEPAAPSAPAPAPPEPMPALEPASEPVPAPEPVAAEPGPAAEPAPAAPEPVPTPEPVAAEPEPTAEPAPVAPEPPAAPEPAPEPARAAAAPPPPELAADAPAEGEAPPRLRLVVGDYQRLVDEYVAGGLRDDESRDAVAWAYVMLANDGASQALSLSGRQADAEWAEAMAKYRAAVGIRPDHVDALYNWASALAARAQERRGADSAGLWTEAVAKYEAALKLRPDDAEALGDCARALVARARWVAPPEADHLVDDALAKLERAYRLRDETAYVGYLEIALAHGRDREIAHLLEERPARLPDPARFALALVYLVFVLERGQPVDLAPFDELPRRKEAPCRDWDFDDIAPAIARLADGDAEFVHAVIDVLQGAMPLADWPAMRAAWLAGRGPLHGARPGAAPTR
ncbi:MAG: tetratricopeptide repeat protein [Alphaproteobacteria bacterium]